MPPTDSNSDKPTILKTTREARGLTLELVHEATKIPMDALKAIEEGYSSRILSPFYYRGFIKIYAEFLGLDPGEMYKQYGLEGAPKPAVSPAVSVKSNREASKPPASNLRVAEQRTGNIIFLERLQEGVSLAFKPKTLKLVFKGLLFLLLLFVLFKMGGCIASHISKIGQGKKAKTHHMDVKTAVVSGQASHGSVAAPSQDNKVEVAVRASQDTWLRVKADDHVVFQMTLNKGAMESWSADDHIELSGRDLELLDMEVNGKQIGFLGGGDRRIRRVLVTPEGLTVKK